MNSLLFTEAKTKKQIAAEKAAIAAAAIAKAEAKLKEPDKKDIYTDARDLKKEDDGPLLPEPANPRPLLPACMPPHPSTLQCLHDSQTWPCGMMTSSNRWLNPKRARASASRPTSYASTFSVRAAPAAPGFPLHWSTTESLAPCAQTPWS
mgnify:CR=1 FL=1